MSPGDLSTELGGYLGLRGPMGCLWTQIKHFSELRTGSAHQSELVGRGEGGACLCIANRGKVCRDAGRGPRSRTWAMASVFWSWAGGPRSRSCTGGSISRPWGKIWGLHPCALCQERSQISKRVPTGGDSLKSNILHWQLAPRLALGITPRWENRGPLSLPH